MNTNVCLNHLEDCPSAEDWALQWLCSSGGLSIIVIAAMTCGIHRLCRREREVLADQPTYSVAISNSLFKEERWELCCEGTEGWRTVVVQRPRGDALPQLPADRDGRDGLLCWHLSSVPPGSPWSGCPGTRRRRREQESQQKRTTLH